jgi:hypothetical protein
MEIQHRLPEGMIESQACKVEEVNIVAEGDFVDATTSRRSAGRQHE